jgi:hypothetical protein
MLVLVPHVQPNYREEMLAARRRLQEQYDAQLKQDAEAIQVSADALLLRNNKVLYQYLYTVFCEPS